MLNSNPNTGGGGKTREPSAPFMACQLSPSISSASLSAFTAKRAEGSKKKQDRVEHRLSKFKIVLYQQCFLTASLKGKIEM